MVVVVAAEVTGTGAAEEGLVTSDVTTVIVLQARRAHLHFDSGIRDLP